MRLTPHMSFVWQTLKTTVRESHIVSNVPKMANHRERSVTIIHSQKFLIMSWQLGLSSGLGNKQCEMMQGSSTNLHLRKTSSTSFPKLKISLNIDLASSPNTVETTTELFFLDPNIWYRAICPSSVWSRSISSSTISSLKNFAISLLTKSEFFPHGIMLFGTAYQFFVGFKELLYTRWRPNHSPSSS